jgi:hypothetical protein
MPQNVKERVNKKNIIKQSPQLKTSECHSNWGWGERTDQAESAACHLSTGTLSTRGSRFLSYNCLQFAIDGKNNSKTKVRGYRDLALTFERS